MRIFPYFQKLFASPLMILPEVRAGLEFDLLRVSGISGVPQAGLAAQAPLPAMSGDHSRDQREYVEYHKMMQGAKASWRVERIYQTYGNIAVVHVAGVIDKHISNADLDCYGGCDLADVDRALAQADADPKIEKVVLAVNSPGGSAIGVPETAARIAAMRERKEVHAFVDFMAGSAAYYIASQADVLAAAPSAIVGSVGVYVTIVDATRAAEMEGYKVELIRAGRWKAMGNPFRPLDEEERAKVQTMVNEMHATFKAAVTEGRANAGKKVAAENLEGQVFRGVEAVAQGLADAVTSYNLDEYVASLL